jgi:hypothetical protein
MYCWGWNDDAQLGTGFYIDSHIPVKVVDMPGKVARLANEEGYGNSCAILESGKFVCWGENDEGSLGIGLVDVDTVPVPIVVPVP